MRQDLTLHKNSIKLHALRQLDFSVHPKLDKNSEMDRLLKKCEKINSNGFKNLHLSEATLHGKYVYKIKSFEHELVLRLVGKEIKNLTRVKQNNRNSIVRSLKTLLQDGGNFKVFKFDLKTFYESVNLEDVLSNFENDKGYSRSHLNLLKDFFSFLDKNSISGLPRGLAISAIIAEYILRSFDEHISKHQSVYFYERFVDDIIIIAHPCETLHKMKELVSKHLPHGLEINQSKTKEFSFEELVAKKNNPKEIQAKINFLGYCFTVFKRKRSANNQIVREVECDISKSKTNKMKTKIIKSLLDFEDNKSFHLLEKRLQLLSGNYTIYDHGRKIKRKAGIFFSYPIVDHAESSSLKELDAFLKKSVLSGKGRIFSKISANLSNKQKRRLLRLSFARGFQNKIFYNYSANEMVLLMRCWKYV